MTKNKLARIQRSVDAIRSQIANVTCDDLEGLAERLGRTKRKGHGGSHHLYDSPLPGRRHVSIPCNPSSRVGKGLAEKILSELEPDIEAWYEWLREEARRKGKRMIGGNGHG